jgi:tRNA pseudouridine55 synthase
MDGILLLNKPAGMTSFSAVHQCRKIFHEKKAGHTGTLDPEATGLLIVLLGKYTKLVPYAAGDHKRYHAVLTFGIRTDTDDVFGNVIDRKEPGEITVEKLQKAADAMIGVREQIPPMVSAVRVNGRKLYEYARKGIEIERKPRLVEYYSLHVFEEKGTIHLEAVVSGGTYIRTLIRDLADSIGEYAVMAGLERTGIETLDIKDAQTLEEAKLHPVFTSPRKIIDPSIPIVECECEPDVIHGRSVVLERAEPLILFAKDDVLLAAYERREDGRYHCLRGLL